MHIVQAQPFESRKKWFYENLYGSNPPANDLLLTDDSSVIEVDRGELGKCEGREEKDEKKDENLMSVFVFSDNIFTTSCAKISESSVNALKENLTIRFIGEAGMVSFPALPPCSSSPSSSSSSLSLSPYRSFLHPHTPPPILVRTIAEDSSLRTPLSLFFLPSPALSQGSGVRREWFESLSTEVLNPDYALFTQSADGKRFFHHGIITFLL